MSVLAAASRVVLGLHWLSGVLAGARVGLVIGAAVWLALFHQMATRPEPRGDLGRGLWTIPPDLA